MPWRNIICSTCG